MRKVGEETDPESVEDVPEVRKAGNPMDFSKVLATLLPVIAGTCLVTQNGVNTNLRLYAVQAALPAATVSFGVGLVCNCVVALIHRPRLGDATLRAPWYCWTGGILGPCYVTAAILLSSKLGFAVYQLCAIAGQLLMSLFIDSVGLLHMKQRKPSRLRVLALAGVLLGAGLTSSVAGNTERSGWTVVYCTASVVAGAVFPLQAVVNSSLQGYVKTPFRAVTISFFVGTVTLIIISAVWLAITEQDLVVEAGEPWMWLGGVLGAVLVTCNVIGTPLMGAASYVTTFLTAQLAAAFVYDSAGAFGFDQLAPSVQRVVGILVAMGAAALYQLAPAGSIVEYGDEASVVPELPPVDAVVRDKISSPKSVFSDALPDHFPATASI